MIWHTYAQARISMRPQNALPSAEAGGVGTLSNLLLHASEGNGWQTASRPDLRIKRRFALVPTAANRTNQGTARRLRSGRRGRGSQRARTLSRACRR